MDVLKPYFVLACVAFMVGFLGYWMLGQALSQAPQLGVAYEAPASAPLPDDGFDRGKVI